MQSIEWKPVVGYEDRYIVSSHGQVRALFHSPTGPIWRTISAFLSVPDKYLRVNLRKDGYSRVLNVHRLVAEAFCGDPGNNRLVRHLDGNKLNNTPRNLRFGTDAENNADAMRHGTQATGWDGIHCKNGHLIDVPENYRPNGTRSCRKCARANYYRKTGTVPQRHRHTRAEIEAADALGIPRTSRARAKYWASLEQK